MKQEAQGHIYPLGPLWTSKLPRAAPGQNGTESLLMDVREYSGGAGRVLAFLASPVDSHPCSCWWGTALLRSQVVGRVGEGE